MKVEAISPGSFESDAHYYPRVLNAQLHPLVRFFLDLSNDRIADRYCHLHPEADPTAVHESLAYKPRNFLWGGADLFHVATFEGVRQNVVIETNSSPSGQKSMPFTEGESSEMGGYSNLLKRAFLPALKRRGLPAGDLAVLSDKNEMETRGYAHALADLTGERVWWVPCSIYDETPVIKFEDRVLFVQTGNEWRPIRAALKYVTQRPWTLIPPITKTMMFNPVLTCLAGGRNKLMAAKAYDLYNAELEGSGLKIRTPETIWDVAKREVPLWVERMGGIAVVKVPYSNAGQGVYTITNERELDQFMEIEHPYELFIVQGLIGNANWSSRTKAGHFYHVGTVPNRKRQIYAADLRFMVGAGTEGYFPVSIYARRARKPLAAALTAGEDSWDMLGTNLSVKAEGKWITEPERLLLMDARDFNKLGIGLDDLTEAYIQSALAVSAIDSMSQRLTTTKGTFRRRLFASLNPDDVLNNEVLA